MCRPMRRPAGIGLCGVRTPPAGLLSGTLDSFFI